MESFIEIIFGRYVFGMIGYIVRKGWLKLSNVPNKKPEVEIGPDEGIDIDDFKNRIVGFACILILIIIVMLLTHYL